MDKLRQENDHNSQIDKMSASNGQMTANSARLKEEVAVLQQELADLASSQASMDKLRQEEHTAFVSDSADMEQGLKGIKLALNILREYYGKEGKSHEAATGAGS